MNIFSKTVNQTSEEHFIRNVSLAEGKVDILVLEWVEQEAEELHPPRLEILQETLTVLDSQLQ